MLILNVDKVVCFDALLQVLIPKGLTLHQNYANCGLAKPVFILNGFKVFGMITSTSVDSRGAAGGRHTSAAGGVRRTAEGEPRYENRDAESAHWAKSTSYGGRLRERAGTTKPL